MKRYKPGLIFYPIIILFIVILVFSALMFFAENYGIFMVLFGLFILYRYMYFNIDNRSDEPSFKDMAGFGLGILLFIFGGLFTFENGITFQCFVNLFM